MQSERRLRSPPAPLSPGQGLLGDCPSPPRCVSILRPCQRVASRSPVSRRMWPSPCLLAPVIHGPSPTKAAGGLLCGIPQAPSRRSPYKRVRIGKKIKGRPLPIHTPPCGGAAGGAGREGRLRCCSVNPNNCGLILQVCIRKHKSRQFVGSSNFQSPESSKNYFGYPR